LATEAAALTADGALPTVQSLAMAIAARAEPDASSARQYARLLLKARTHAKERELSSAQARLRAEQLTLDNERLTAQAYIDGLTGIGNRFTLDRHRERLRAGHHSETAAVLVMDLDKFKPVNDTYGHAVGDDVLRRIADLLRRVSRPTDLAVRLGGDEFVLILHASYHAGARERAQLITKLVAATNWSDLTPDIAVGISIGVATGPATGIDDLLQAADRDMYDRKNLCHKLLR
jgi:diguanylate cyclase (GGDEF)-like protein